MLGMHSEIKRLLSFDPGGAERQRTALILLPTQSLGLRRRPGREICIVRHQRRIAHLINQCNRCSNILALQMTTARSPHERSRHLPESSDPTDFRRFIGGISFQNRTNGLTYGVQAETWW